MNISAGRQLDALATNASNGIGMVILKKALDNSTSSAAQLLTTLPQAQLPQKDSSGNIVDTYA